MKKNTVLRIGFRKQAALFIGIISAILTITLLLAGDNIKWATAFALCIQAIVFLLFIYSRLKTWNIFQPEPGVVYRLAKIVEGENSFWYVFEVLRIKKRDDKRAYTTASIEVYDDEMIVFENDPYQGQCFSGLYNEEGKLVFREDGRL